MQLLVRYSIFLFSIHYNAWTCHNDPEYITLIEGIFDVHTYLGLYSDLIHTIAIYECICLGVIGNERQLPRSRLNYPGAAEG